MVQRKKPIADQASACAQKRLDCFFFFQTHFLFGCLKKKKKLMSLSDGVAPCGMSNVLLNRMLAVFFLVFLSLVSVVILFMLVS